MNEINANRRLKEAAQFRADAEKITLVKAAVSFFDFPPMMIVLLKWLQINDYE
jgi:hypothetical protein